MTILDKIIEHKIQELAVKSVRIPVARLEKLPGYARKPKSITAALLDPDKTGIIAEFKRKSPSKGILNDAITLEEVIIGYVRAGASALSVLTDTEFFGGSREDLIRACELAPIPILRKDFIIDEYQVIETKAWGADAVLLIAAALDAGRIKDLARKARSLDLEVILEVHHERELAMTNDFINIVGVNNRDLGDFSVDVNRSMELADKIPSGFIKISESGINSPIVVKQLRHTGFQGFLIGENFMRTPDPPTAFSEFVKQLI